MLHRIPRWFQNLFPAYTWHIKSKEKVIYLTFDDGPIPEITQWVLNVLDDYDAKASFFVVGENVTKNPQSFQKIIEGGHAIGNHTYNHMKGWNASVNSFVDNVEKGSKAIVDNGGEFPQYFRPPHGRIKPSQARILRQNYKLIMWSVLSVDYDKSLNAERCLKNTIKATEPGAIVVFHDSIKAEKNLRYVLPKYMDHFSKIGYTFKKL